MKIGIALIKKRRMKKAAKALLFFALILTIGIFVMSPFGGVENETTTSEANEDFIKYVEFNVTYAALEKAMKIDIESQSGEVKINWIDLLSYLGAKYGGNFKSYKAKDLDELAARLRDNEKIEDITADMKHFNYYREAYGAVLREFLGEYTEYSRDESGNITQTKKYGLKAYSPVAKTFPFSHSDDFGARRSYGYSRPHLGHDMMAATGTPVIAVEGGYVECAGWNQYGGWRVGIRSHDKKRYYYYAHLRQNRPYHPDIKEGAIVEAGDVIGYVGRTGYSTTENANNIQTSHLHWGLQLIFDESQKECVNEIWIDIYPITKLLQKHQSSTLRNAETKEFYSLRQNLLLPKDEQLGGTTLPETTIPATTKKTDTS